MTRGGEGVVQGVVLVSAYSAQSPSFSTIPQ